MRFLLAPLLVALPLALQAQTPLDAYVDEGLSHSLTLAEDRLSLAEADAGVREARGRWLPSLTVNARYSERSGNLTDLGALVNPAFGALNQLLGRNAFPTDISLTLPYKQETGVRLSQPLFQPAVAAGSAIARSVREAQAAATATSRRSLAAHIRLAYLDVARAAQVEALARATLALLDENLRVNQALVEQGAGTPDVVLRAQADHREGEQRLADALRLRLASEQQFNLLLERPLDAAVLLLPDSMLGIAFDTSVDDAIQSGLAGREELRQLLAGEAAAHGQERLARAAFLPTITAAIDYGIQGDRYRFQADQDFLIASVVLQWNLFNGGQDRARMTRAQLTAERFRTEQSATARQIELEIRIGWQAAAVAREAQATAASREASAESNYRLHERRYREGAASSVELIDARTSYIAAQLNRILTTYDFLARCVDLDRAAARYPVAPIGAGAE